ncbi:hypothetical protein [Allomesorhizobium camelthorni]|uniref:DUF680 domain-containing protein n=1 Tax=Allomesorhizobium camelthorni TaxID=475069 RepID=A0A6G4W6E6_9HYPH|nr:hypothetical protein [Mesorhizobium camelthorni]NGO49898.1 hypothetical protein [Mesorhizobium camelthorni]
MKKIALALAGILALSGNAFANDFAATLHYPESPRSEPQPTRKALDSTVTYSIKPEISRKVAPRRANDAPGAVKDRRSGVTVDPWIVPNFR